ncbi:MAG: (4Fe-4S)-binding protein, partial [Pseudomonadota bacterium]
MSLDEDALSQATGLEAPRICSALCTTELSKAAAALQAGDAIICCTQEARTFEALAEDLGVEPPAVLDLRDRAGWTDDAAPTLPK